MHFQMSCIYWNQSGNKSLPTPPIIMMSVIHVVVLCQVNNFSAISYWQEVRFWSDDNDGHFVLDQHT
jgi:hypothetical protein